MILALRQPLVLLFAFAALVMGTSAVYADHHAGDKKADKIKVGIMTGQNNHAWFNDSPAMKSILDDAGLFETTLLISPDKKDPKKAEKWKTFDPKFADYDVIILNYNGEMWPDRIKKDFEAYISGGGKAYSFHAGNNPFRGWAEYEQMIGLLWRNNKGGKRVFFDEQGNKQVMDAGKGPGAGHGRQHDFLITTRDTNHPIFEGLPAKWMHVKDELYHGQRGPAENMTVLLTAHADASTRGTGVIEPIAWTIPFGKGLVLTNVLGHWMGDAGPALQCAGFQTIFTRSIEWLATGKVTQAKPDDFPTADKISKRDLKFETVAYLYVPGVPGSDPHASCGCSQQTQPGQNPAWAQYAEMLLPVPGEATAKH